MRIACCWNMSSAGRALRLPALVLVLAALAGCADLRVAREAMRQNDVETARDHWERLAQKGFPDAAVGLARLYAGGHMGKERVAEAIVHFERAILLGHESAQSAMARFLIRHSLQFHNPERIVQHIRNAAEGGSVHARLAMSDLYFDGTGVEQNPEKAVVLLIEMTDISEAAYRLGVIYREDIYAPRDYVQALAYFKQAAAVGHIRAELAQVDFYLNGWGIPADVNHAKALLSDLADRGSLPARFKLAAVIEQEGGAEPSAEALGHLRKAATGGFAPASFRMADFYLRGRGLPQDVERAMRMLHDLSDRDYGPASARLGDLYRDGDNVQLDYSRAISFYELALEQGFERAELRIARMIHNGWGMDRDLKTALAVYLRHGRKGDAGAAYNVGQVMEDLAAERNEPLSADVAKWYQRAHDAGHVEAGMRLADLYFFGNGVQQDLARSFAIVSDLSAQGEGRASRRLGEIYANPDREYSDVLLAQKYLAIAVEQGDRVARIRLADLYARPDTAISDAEKAIALYRNLLEEGDIPATFKLARMLERRMGENAITPEILGWYRKARDAHYPPAMIRYADMQLEGIGLLQDVEAALGTYRGLSSRGVGQATFRLGKMHESGIGQGVDYARAVAFYRKSFQQGYELADLQLARFYGEGLGVEQDVDHAIEIYLRFYRQGNDKAPLGLGRLYRFLGSKQEAVTWLLRATELGNTQAWYELALLYEDIAGKPVPDSIAALQQASSAGHGRAKLLLGERIFAGQSTEPNQLEGLAMMLEAVRLQVPQALKLTVERMHEVEQAGTITKANVLAKQRIDALF